MASLVRIDDTEDERNRRYSEEEDSDDIFYPSGEEDDDSTELSSLAGSGSEESVDGESYFYADDPVIQPDNRVFKRALLVLLSISFCVIVLVLASLLLIFLPSRGEDDSDRVVVEGPYQHNLRVSIPDRECSYDVHSPMGCTADVNDVIGCQVGCGFTDLGLQCGLNVTLEWRDVNVTDFNQWIYLMATIDGEHWWQTGFAQPLLAGGPIIIGNQTVEVDDDDEHRTSGEVVITDGCFGSPYQELIVVACLSSEEITKGKFFHWFPKDLCNATYGICIPTNNVALLPHDQCNGEEWEGNTFESKWNAPYWSSASMVMPLPMITAAMTMMVVLGGWCSGEWSEKQRAQRGSQPTR